MADDAELDVAVAVIWTFVALAIVAIVVLIYLYMTGKACFERKRRTIIRHASSSGEGGDGGAAAIDMNVRYYRVIQATPAAGYFETAPLLVKLVVKFPSDEDKQFVLAHPDNFRLLYRVTFAADPYSPPVAVTPRSGVNGGATFVRYPGPIALPQRGRYTVHAYAAVWRNEQLPCRIAELEGTTSAPNGIGGNGAVARFDYFVGVDPALFALSLDFADSIDIRGGEGLLEMQRRIALHLKPPPGTYVAPLLVRATPALHERYVVTVSPQYMMSPAAVAAAGASEPPSFLLSVTGNHIVSLTARDPNQCSSIEMAAVYVLRPPPPEIDPARGTVTEVSPITIASPACLTDVNLKHLYSTDGGEPALFYGGPFTVPCGEGGSGRACRILARTIGRDGTQSDVAVAQLDVTGASEPVPDLSIPSPVCVVSALEPKLVLLHHDDEERTHDVRFFYRVMIDDATNHGSRRAAAAAAGAAYQQQYQQSASDAAFKLYDARNPIPIDDTHCLIEAYAERASNGERSHVVHYSWSESLLDAAHGFEKSRRNSKSRGSRDNSQHRDPAASGVPLTTLLRPPVMSVQCSGATLHFDDPPNRRFVIRYTLDGTAPDENRGLEFAAGTEVDVSEFLRAAGTIQVVARYYVQRSDPREPLRYGRTFTREFNTPIFSGATRGYLS